MFPSFIPVDQQINYKHFYQSTNFNNQQFFFEPISKHFHYTSIIQPLLQEMAKSKTVQQIFTILLKFKQITKLNKIQEQLETYYLHQIDQFRKKIGKGIQKIGKNIFNHIIQTQIHNSSNRKTTNQNYQNQKKQYASYNSLPYDNNFNNFSGSQRRNFYHDAQNQKHRIVNYKRQQFTQFQILYQQYQSQIPYIFSSLALFVLNFHSNLTNTNFKIPILKQGIERQILLKKQDVFYMMCLMALNLVPPYIFNKLKHKKGKHDLIDNFSYIFKEKKYKTKTIIEYFLEYLKYPASFLKDQNLIIRRQVSEGKLQGIFQANSNKKMLMFHLKQDQTSIQSFYQMGKVNFANRSIGGGSLMNGCVQQQIMFANHPQLYVSILLCEPMKQNQSMFFAGFKKYSDNYGYGYETSYKCQQYLPYQKDHRNIPKEFIISIDATQFKNKYDRYQFSIPSVERQLLKAYTGFNVNEQIHIVTGNWGCGAFNGDVRLKFLLQWIASSLAGKTMIYCPYGKMNILSENQKICEYIINHNYTADQLYKLVKRTIASRDCCQLNIFQALKAQINSQKNQGKKIENRNNYQVANQNNFYQKKYTPSRL